VLLADAAASASVEFLRTELEEQVRSRAQRWSNAALVKCGEF
jgi:hypothetical protein